jgi:Xaa-Pro aminopeptidase
MRKATLEEKDAYTRVLLGNLAVERLIWPKKELKTYEEIDIVARNKVSHL